MNTPEPGIDEPTVDLTQRVEAVKNLYAEWGRGLDAMSAALKALAAEDFVWDSPPIPRMNGLASAQRALERSKRLGFGGVDVEILGVAAHGDKVFVERIDHIRRADGTLVASAPTTGVMTFGADGRLVHWREYYDFYEMLYLAAKSSVQHGFRQAWSRLRGRSAR